MAILHAVQDNKSDINVEGTGYIENPKAPPRSHGLPILTLIVSELVSWVVIVFHWVAVTAK